MLTIYLEGAILIRLPARKLQRLFPIGWPRSHVRLLYVSPKIRYFSMVMTPSLSEVIW